MPIVDIDVPDEVLIHTLSVERQTGAGHDAQGNLVEVWTPVYTGLRGTAVPLEHGARLSGGRAGGGGAGSSVFEQVEMTIPYEVYLAALTDGSVPDIRAGDRIPFGTWPGGAPRTIQVTAGVDVLDAGVIVTVHGIARKPG